MIDKMSKEPTVDQELQMLLEQLKDRCISPNFGNQLAEDSVERHFPKW